MHESCVMTMDVRTRLAEATPLTASPSLLRLISTLVTNRRLATRLVSVPQTLPRCDRCSVVCATRSGRSKTAKKKSGKADKGGNDFDRLMLIWDNAFEKCCETPHKLERLTSIAKQGLEKHGRGCLLVSESVRTLPRGSGSGFTNKFRPDSDETPAYTSLEWTAEYVPRALIEDPTASDDQTPVSSQPAADEFPLVKPSNWLAAVRRMLDRTRLLSLTCSSQAEAEDAGGEMPYNAEADEFVLVLCVLIDGRATVGADVVRGVGDGAERKLMVRDLVNL